MLLMGPFALVGATDKSSVNHPAKHSDDSRGTGHALPGRYVLATPSATHEAQGKPWKDKCELMS